MNESQSLHSQTTAADIFASTKRPARFYFRRGKPKPKVCNECRNQQNLNIRASSPILDDMLHIYNGPEMARPREFNEEKVLKAAVDAFWAKGYVATSTRDLTECTGLTQSSIYAAFGDKRGIFLRALEYYLDHLLRSRIVRLETSLPAAQAISGFFSEALDRALADPKHRGCMLVNTALEATSEDPELRRLVANETVMIEQFFRRCIIAGQRTGEIRTDCSADDGARHLLAVLLGTRVLARIRPKSELLMGLVGPALESLGIPWPQNVPKRPGQRAVCGTAD
ncbi:TetR/AcrR family transcriptional regulator [Bradyrhizobium sp. 151]|uniref:TetR/AcrR family transcriptional regulator n=1 Tax=Bradyrhizobium sp. 151 TaxID=2782626 RepID=UPI001FF9A3BF